MGRHRQAISRRTRGFVTPVRLLIVAPVAQHGGGAEEVLRLTLRRLDRERIEPEIGFLSAGVLVDEIRTDGFTTWSVESARLRNPIAYVRTVRSLVKRVRKAEPDVVLAWSAKSHLYLGVAALFVRPRPRVLWWQHLIPTGHWVDRLATLLPSDGIGCCSRAAEVAQRVLKPRRRTFVVHPGIEVPHSYPLVERADLGIDEDAWVVGIVGRLQPWKRQHTVIQAVADLAKRGVDCVGLIVGGSAFGLSVEYAAELRELANRLGVHEKIVFTGQVDEPFSYYALMDAVVNASEGEPFGLVVVEAMAAKRPAVVYPLGGPLEIVEDGVSGLMVSEQGLTNTLLQLNADPNLASRIAERGYDRATTTFSAQASADRFTEAILAATRDPSGL